MATYNVKLPDGSAYNIEADSDAQASAAVDDLTKTPQWSDIPGNIAEGIKETPQTLAGMGSALSEGLTLTSPVSMLTGAAEMAAGMPAGHTEYGQAAKSFMGNASAQMKALPGQIKEFAKDPLTSIKNQIIQHPISTAATVAGAAMPLAEGALDTAAQYAGRFGENQALKSLGARGGQLGSVGIPESRAIGREMVERGVIKPLQGPIGLEEKVKGLHDTAGENIGAARDVADARDEAAGGGAAPTRESLVQLAKDKFGPSFESGHLAPRAGTFQQVLETVDNPVISDMQKTNIHPGTFSGNAAKATELNAAGTPDKALSQSKDSPYSSVANAISKQNNAAMAKVLSPEEMAAHEGDLKDYGTLDKVRKFMESGEKREMSSRGGATISKTLYDKTMDSFGNRASAWAGIHGSNALEAVAKNAGTTGGTISTAGIMSRVANNPQSLGQYAKPLLGAMQSGGQQGVAAMHYVLSQQHPEYNALLRQESDQPQQ